MRLPFLPLLLFLTFHCSFTSPDLEADRRALLALRSAVGGRTFLWNASSPSPCRWTGVKCEGSRVTALRLPGVALTGSIPLGVFGNLTELRTISLRINALLGPIPSDLASCIDLRSLYLQGNLLSGEIPEFLFSLRNLVRLNLAGNKFSGVISPSFNNLTRLKTLYIESNSLVGSIPELMLPKIEQFNVSFNQLNGSVPESLRKMSKDSFLGISLCGGPFDPCIDGRGVNSTPASDSFQSETTMEKKKKLSAGAIVGIVIGSLFAVLLILLILLLFCWKKGGANARSIDIASVKYSEMEIQGEKQNGELENIGNSNGFSVAAAAAAALLANENPKSDVANGGAKKLVFFSNAGKVYDLEDLLRASAEVLGKGTFGTAYKAVMEFGTAVAVKRLKDVTVSESEFREMIEAVGEMNHENLVPMRAYYYSRDEKLLVYDYLPMGSLSALLHGNKGAGRTPLNWEFRSNIALGAARGLSYLHSHDSNLSHGNIKSSNILLTKSYDACVSDFGLAHLVGPSSTPNRVSGYRAPEVTNPSKVSQKADVYSFGVLLLELLTGKAPSHAILNEEGIDLPRWVNSVVQEEWTSEVFDLELLRYQNVEEEMVQLLQLAIDCAAQHPDNRPSMSEVARQIEELRRSSQLDDQDLHPDVVQGTNDGSSSSH